MADPDEPARLRQSWATLVYLDRQRLKPLFQKIRNISLVKKELGKRPSCVLSEAEYETYAKQLLQCPQWTQLILPGWEAKLAAMPGVERLQDKLIFHPPGKQITPRFQIRCFDTMTHEVNLQRALAQDPEQWDAQQRQRNQDDNQSLASFGEDCVRRHAALPYLTDADLEDFWKSTRLTAVKEVYGETPTPDDVMTHLAVQCKEWEYLIGPGCSGVARPGKGGRTDIYLVPPISGGCDTVSGLVEGLNKMRTRAKELFPDADPAGGNNGTTAQQQVPPSATVPQHEPLTNGAAQTDPAEDEEDMQVEEAFAEIRKELWPPYASKTADDLRRIFRDLCASGPKRNHHSLVLAVIKWHEAKGRSISRHDVYRCVLRFLGLGEDQVEVVTLRPDRCRKPEKFVWKKGGKKKQVNFRTLLLHAAPVLLAQAPELPVAAPEPVFLDLETGGGSYSSHLSTLHHAWNDRLDPSIADVHQQLAQTEYREIASNNLNSFSKLRRPQQVEQRIGLMGLNGLGKSMALDKLAGAMLVMPEEYARLNAPPAAEGLLTKPERDALAHIHAQDRGLHTHQDATVDTAAVSFGYNLSDAEGRPWLDRLPAEAGPARSGQNSIYAEQRRNLGQYLQTPSDRSSLTPSRGPASYFLSVGSRNTVTTKGITEIAYDTRFSLAEYYHPEQRMKEKILQYSEQLQRAAALRARNAGLPYDRQYEDDPGPIPLEKDLKALKRWFHAVVDPDPQLHKDWKQTRVDYSPEHLAALPSREEDIELCAAAAELAKRRVFFRVTDGRDRDGDHAAVRSAHLASCLHSDGETDQELTRREILREKTVIYAPTRLCSNGHRFVDNTGLNDNDPHHEYSNKLLYELPPAEGGADVILALTSKDADGDQSLLRAMTNFKVLSAKKKGEKQIIIARLNEKDDLASSPCMLYNSDGQRELKQDFLERFSQYFRALEDRDPGVEDGGGENHDLASWLDCIATIPMLNLRPVLQAALLVHPDWQPPALNPSDFDGDVSRALRSDVENSTGISQLMGALEHELSVKRNIHLEESKRAVCEARLSLQTGFLQGETEATMKGLQTALQGMAADDQPDVDPQTEAFGVAAAGQIGRLLAALFQLDDADADDALSASMQSLRPLEDQRALARQHVEHLIALGKIISTNKRSLRCVLNGNRTLQLPSGKATLPEALMQLEENDEGEDMVSIPAAAETLMEGVLEAVQTEMEDVKAWATSQIRDCLQNRIRQQHGDQENILRLLQHMAEYYVKNVASFVSTLEHIGRIRGDFLKKLAASSYMSARQQTYSDIPAEETKEQLKQRLLDGLDPLLTAARFKWHADALALLTEHLNGAKEELSKTLSSIRTKFCMWAKQSIKQNLKKSGPVTSSISNLIIAAEQIEAEITHVQRDLPSHRVARLAVTDIERLIRDGDDTETVECLVTPFWKQVEECGAPLISEMRRQAALSHCLEALGDLASEQLVDMADVSEVSKSDSNLTTYVSTKSLLAGDAAGKLLEYVSSLAPQQAADEDQQPSPAGAQRALAEARVDLSGPATAAQSLLDTAYRLSRDADMARNESQALEEMMRRALTTSSGSSSGTAVPTCDSVAPLLDLLAWCRVTASNILLPSALGGSAGSFLMLHSSRKPKTAFVMAMVCHSPASASASSSSSSSATGIKFFPVVPRDSQRDRVLGKRPADAGAEDTPSAPALRRPRHEPQAATAQANEAVDSYQDVQIAGRQGQQHRSLSMSNFIPIRESHAAFAEFVSYYLPDFRKAYQGDDHHVVTSFGAFSGDGVSGSNQGPSFGRHSSVLAQDLVKHCVQQADRHRGQPAPDGNTNIALWNVLQPACEQVRGEGGPFPGATTISVAVISGKQLHVASLGDTSVIVLRRNKTRSGLFKCIYYSEDTYFPGGTPQHPVPGQLYFIPTDSTRARCRLTQPRDVLANPETSTAIHTEVLDLEHGDIVLGGSDGMIDHLGHLPREARKTLIEQFANRPDVDGNVRSLGGAIYHHCQHNMHTGALRPTSPDDLTLWVARVSTKITDALPAQPPDGGPDGLITFKLTPPEDRPLRNKPSAAMRMAGVARGAVMLQVGGAAPAGTRVPQCLERPAAILRKSGSDRKLLPPALELFVILSAAVPS
eukprot:jgi/Tetstr1/424227/TSEL_000157.t1